MLVICSVLFHNLTKEDVPLIKPAKMFNYSSLSLSILLISIFTINLSLQSRQIRDVSGSPPQSNGKIADFALKALGSFKSFMQEGSNELGIPSLDPVHMENFNYSVENNPVGFKMGILFETPVLTGLSSYELSGASEIRSNDGNGMLLQMTVVFPTIQIRGQYKAGGNLFGFFNMDNFGDFQIHGSSQVLAAEAKLRAFNQSFQVDYVTSQFVGGRVKSQFKDGTSGTASFPSLMGELLSAMGTNVFDNKLKPVITRAMNDYMKEWLNGAFGSVGINEILQSSSSSQQGQQGEGQGVTLEQSQSSNFYHQYPQ